MRTLSADSTFLIGAMTAAGQTTQGIVSRRFFAVSLASILLMLASAPIASAATFTVNSSDDFSDANPGDGACATGTGNCTLRAAIEESNALPGSDTVNLPPGTYSWAPKATCR